LVHLLGQRAFVALLLRFFYKFPSILRATDLHENGTYIEKLFNKRWNSISTFEILNATMNKQTANSKAHSSSIYKIDYPNYQLHMPIRRPMSHFLHCLLTFFLHAAHFLCLPPSLLSRTWPVGESLVAIITLEDSIFGRPADFGSEAD